jgi:hypothetical protein
MTSLYESYLAFRATIPMPSREPLTTVPNARKNRVPKWKGERTRRVKMEGKP